MRLVQAGQDAIVEAPTEERPAAVEAAYLTVEAPGSKYVSFTGYPSLPNMRFVAFGQWVRSPSLSSYLESYVYLVAGGWAPGSQVVFTVQWDAAFPLCAVGSRCFARVFVQDTNGLRSLPADCSTTAVAP